MDELNVINNANEIIKYCKNTVCINCIFHEDYDYTKCMWRNSIPEALNLSDIVLRWVVKNE